MCTALVIPTRKGHNEVRHPDPQIAGIQKGRLDEDEGPRADEALARTEGPHSGDLAFLAGCTQQTISLLETGKMTTLTEDLAIAIAKRLGHDWEDLFVACEAAVVPVAKSDVNSSSRGLVSA